MSDPNIESKNRLSDSHDKKLQQQSRQILDTHAENLSPGTRAALRQARREAISRSDKKSFFSLPTLMWPGLAMGLCVAVLLRITPEQTQAPIVAESELMNPIEDLELLSNVSEQDWELLTAVGEDIAFTYWLAQEWEQEHSNESKPYEQEDTVGRDA